MRPLIRFAPTAAFWLLALAAQVSGYTNPTAAAVLAAIGALLLLWPGIYYGLRWLRERREPPAAPRPTGGQGGKGGSGEVSGRGVVIGGRGGGGGPLGYGSGGDGGSGIVRGDGIVIGGEGGEAGQQDRGGMGGQTAAAILNLPNRKLPDGTWLWDRGQGGRGAYAGPPDPKKLAAIDEIYEALDRAERVYDYGCDVIGSPWRQRILDKGSRVFGEDLKKYRSDVSDAIREVADLCRKKHSGFPEVYRYQEHAFDSQGQIFNPMSDFIEGAVMKLPEKCSDANLDLIEGRAQAFLEGIAAFGNWARWSKDKFREMRG